MAPSGTDSVSPLASCVPQTSLVLGIAGASSKLLPQLANLDTFQDATVCKSYSEDTQVESTATPSRPWRCDSENVHEMPLSAKSREFIPKPFSAQSREFVPSWKKAKEEVAHSDSTPSDGFHSDSAPSDGFHSDSAPSEFDDDYGYVYVPLTSSLDDDYGLDAQAEDSWLTAKAVADSEDRWLMKADPDENDPANEADLDPSEGRRRGELLMSMLDMTGGTYPVNSADTFNSRSGASKKGVGGSRLLASAPAFMPSHDMPCMWGESALLPSAPAFQPAMPAPRQPLQDAIARHHPPPTKSYTLAEMKVLRKAEKTTPLRSPLVSSAPAFTPMSQW